MSSEERLERIVIPLLNSCLDKIVLDVACGFGRWGHQIRYFSSSYLIGLDLWKPYLFQTKGKQIYDDLILADATKLPFKEKSIDICCACEIIEHLSRSKGKIFLASLEDICREKIIISTPNCKYPQHELRGNPYEKHISFWKSSDLEKVGYKVTGIGVQIGEKIFFRKIPLIGRLFKKLVLHRKLMKFAELVAGRKDLETNEVLGHKRDEA